MAKSRPDGIRHRQHLRLAAGIAVLLLASSCSTPMPRLPASDVPSHWQGPVDTTAQTWPATDWWNNFKSPALTRLIRQVEKHNFDLVINRRNLRAAQLTLKQAGFDLWPTPTVDLSLVHDRSSINGEPANLHTVNSSTLDASITYNNILSKPATWQGATAQYDSSVAAAADTKLNTLGTAASTWFQILLLRDKIAAARIELADAQEIYRIAEAKVRAGTLNQVDALQQQIAVEQQRSQLRSYRQSELQAKAALALLLGRSVQGFTVPGKSLDDVALPSVRPGLPSGLLIRRPDIVEARANLRAAHANLVLATTALFPEISLTGTASLISQSLRGLVESPIHATGGTASLVETLLDNGSRWRDREKARLTMASALDSYRKVVLAAFNDVDVALGNIATLKLQARAAGDDVQRAQEAYRLASVRYRDGVGDYQTLLTAQTTLSQTRNTWLDTRLLQLNAMVNFYEALGGGWKNSNNDRH